jgi:hypothetical protein
MQTMDFPKTYQPLDAPVTVLELVSQLMPMLIEGDHPALVALRQQYSSAQIKEVEMTGVGFFVNFEVRPDAPLADPPDFAGGSATIEITHAPLGAGIILFVRDGRLSFLEGYTYGNDQWAEDAAVLAVKDVKPIHPG